MGEEKNLVCGQYTNVCKLRWARLLKLYKLVTIILVFYLIKISHFHVIESLTLGLKLYTTQNVNILVKSIAC
jgi:hypothetical protein